MHAVLHEAARNWLFGLPSPPQNDLPPNPYLGLHWYSFQQAEIFFGRGKEIRDLYDLITGKDRDYSIVLVCGASGVGKSSLLDAGLMPRLEADSIVRYSRLGSNLSLLESLTTTIEKMDGVSVKDSWHHLESIQPKPVTIIIDQVEGVFLANDQFRLEELSRFAEEMCSLFAERKERPRGRLVLSFRKEWLAEIENWLASIGLINISKIYFVQPMGRDSIEEVIDGPIKSTRLNNKYNLSVTDEARHAILERIVSDDRSPVAPTLQILLTKMWEVALARSKHSPLFDKAVFNAVTKGFAENNDKKFLLDEFLGQLIGDKQKQLSQNNDGLPSPQSLRDWNSEVVDSGLALDLLMMHTTELSTAGEVSLTELKKIYSHRIDILEPLILQYKDLFLLSEPAMREGEISQGAHKLTATRLAHDTLAPLVRNRFQSSDCPGQLARRILESRVEAGLFFSPEDLKIIEHGLKGMRQITEDEQNLLNKSKLKRLFLRALISAVTIFFFITLATIGYQSYQIYNKNNALIKSKTELEEKNNTLNSELLVVKAEEIRDTNVQLSLLLATEAMTNGGNKRGEYLIRRLLEKKIGVSIFSPDQSESNWDMASLALDSNSNAFALGSSNKLRTVVYDLSLAPKKIEFTLSYHPSIFQISPGQSWLLIGDKKSGISFIDLSKKSSSSVISRDKTDFGGAINRIALDENGNWLGITFGGSLIEGGQIWHKSGSSWERFCPSIGVPETASGIVIAQNGKWAALSSLQPYIFMFDLLSNKCSPTLLKPPQILNERITTLASDTESKFLYTGGLTGTIHEWKINNNIFLEHGRTFEGARGSIEKIVISPDSSWVIAGVKEWNNNSVGGAWIWKLSGGGNKVSAERLNSGNGLVANIVFSKNSRWLAIQFAGNRQINVWDLNKDISKPTLVLEGIEDTGLTLGFDFDDQNILIASRDGGIRRYSLVDGPELSWSHLVDFSPTANLSTISCDASRLAVANTNNLIMVWSLKPGNKPGSPKVLPTKKGIDRILFSCGRLGLAAWKSNSNDVELWDEDLQSKQEISLNEPITAVAIGPNHVAISTRKSLELINIDDTNKRKILPKGRNLSKLEFSREGLSLVGARNGSSISLGINIHYSSKEGYEVPRGEKSKALFWNVEAQVEPSETPFEQAINSFKFVGGKLVILGVGDRQIEWNPANDQTSVPKSAMQYGNDLIAIATNSDGSLRAFVVADGTAYIQRLNDRIELPKANDKIISLAFTDDGKWLVSLSEKAQLRFWPVHKEELLEQVKTTVGRNLTCNEWEKFFGKQIYKKTFADLPHGCPKNG